ncbi:MAG: hypothetical protein MJ250_07650 [Alphaproteobacteria bacterium]|nr:hypothetical protein [Alphaproteobacteria bacterium]
MEKTEKNTIEETKDNEIVELKDEDMSTITAGSGTPKNGKFLTPTYLKLPILESHNNGCDKICLSGKTIPSIDSGTTKTLS